LINLVAYLVVGSSEHGYVRCVGFT